MREMGCIYSIASLLLKLFPGGASVDYIEDEFMGKLLGQLLTLVSISVKNNKENKIYTFQNTMRIIQKYVMPKVTYIDWTSSTQSSRGQGIAFYCREL